MNRLLNIAAIMTLVFFSAGISEAEIYDDNDTLPVKSTTTPEIATKINPILLLLLGMSDDATSSNWSTPQSILDGVDTDGDIAMTIDAAGNWHMVNFSFNSNVFAVKYFNSMIAPNSETIAEYPRCTQPSCEPGQIRDLEDNAIIHDLNGRFHVAYSVELPGGGNKIMVTFRP